MPLLTQFQTLFLSPFGEPSACEELNRFLRSHRIVNVEKRLVDGERGTGWLFLIEYGQENKGAPPAAKDRVDYREILSEQEYALFERLRQLRKELAEKNGVPVYAVFTNDQLAAMVKHSPKTPSELHKMTFASSCCWARASRTHRAEATITVATSSNPRAGRRCDASRTTNAGRSCGRGAPRAPGFPQWSWLPDRSRTRFYSAEVDHDRSARRPRRC